MNEAFYKHRRRNIMVIQSIGVSRHLENKSYYPCGSTLCQGQFVEDCSYRLQSPAHLHWRNWDLITGATSPNLPLWRLSKSSKIRVNRIALSAATDFWNLIYATFFVSAASVDAPRGLFLYLGMRAIYSQDYTSWGRAFVGISRTNGS